jgi:hypothetical protein
VSDLIQHLKSVWAQFDNDALEQLEPMYAADAVFIEPAGRIVGRDAVFKHFRASCSNMLECNFAFDPSMEMTTQHSAYLPWSMSFRHSRLNSGAVVTCSGVSYLVFDDQITLHRDWFDLGAAVYEHIPLLGYAVRAIKKQIHSH